MQNQHLIEIGHALLHGSVSIENWWKENAVFLSSIQSVSSAEEVAIWSSAYFNYGKYLLNKGYAKKAYSYVDKALTIIDNNKQLLGDQYNDWSATIRETKSAVLFKIGKKWEAYKIMKQLHEEDIEKDDYKSAMENIFSSCIWSFVWPCYAVIACLWLFSLIDKHALHLNLFPSWMWDVTWAIWLVLIAVQFVVPYVMKKIRK